MKASLYGALWIILLHNIKAVIGEEKVAQQLPHQVLQPHQSNMLDTDGDSFDDIFNESGIVIGINGKPGCRWVHKCVTGRKVPMCWWQKECTQMG